MSAFHLIAALPNGGRKSVFNRDRSQMVDHVVEFFRDGTLTTQWGKAMRTRQAYEIRIFETPEPYNKKSSGAFDEFVAGRRNQFARFEKDAKKRLDSLRQRLRVFVVMPIQGR